jgi:hypothetical protein
MHAQKARGDRLVPAGTVKRAQNEQPLDVPSSPPEVELILGRHLWWSEGYVQRDLVELHERLGGERDGARHDILKLPDVTRPVVALKGVEGVRGQIRYCLTELARVLRQEMPGERRHVCASLAKRGNGDRHHVDAIVQVFPEPARCHRLT